MKKLYLYLINIAIFAIMFIFIINGLNSGGFFEEGKQLLSLKWGVISLIDVYAGFIIFSLWIVIREKNIVVKTVWIVLIMVLGNMITPLYVIKNLMVSKTKEEFFLGKKIESK